jgi:hypothetical protein
MQKSLYALCLFFLPACYSIIEPPKEKETALGISNIVEPAIDTGVMILASPPEDAQVIPDTVRVDGYFDEDTSCDKAYGVFFGRTHSDGGNDMEAATEKQYIVRFKDNRIRPMPVMTGRHIRLVNEGDLNADGQDEISIFVLSMRSCMYTASTWSYTAGRWTRITDYWSIPTVCDYLSDEDLQNRIVMEDGMLYYYETDVSDKDLPLVKKELLLK